MQRRSHEDLHDICSCHAKQPTTVSTTCCPVSLSQTAGTSSAEMPAAVQGGLVLPQGYAAVHLFRACKDRTVWYEHAGRSFWTLLRPTGALPGGR